MNNNAYIQELTTKYEVNQSTGLIHCRQSVNWIIFGEKKHFQGEGYAHCTKENIFDVDFGKAIAEIRALQNIYKQIEISLVKYSFDHFVREVDNETEFNKKLIKLVDGLKRRSKCY